jgi:hypothetical protein
MSYTRSLRRIAPSGRADINGVLLYFCVAVMMVVRCRIQEMLANELRPDPRARQLVKEVFDAYRDQYNLNAKVGRW